MLDHTPEHLCQHMTKSEAGKSCLGASDSLRTQVQQQLPTTIARQMCLSSTRSSFMAKSLIFIKTDFFLFFESPIKTALETFKMSYMYMPDFIVLSMS